MSERERISLSCSAWFGGFVRGCRDIGGDFRGIWCDQDWGWRWFVKVGIPALTIAFVLAFIVSQCGYLNQESESQKGETQSKTMSQEP